MSASSTETMPAHEQFCDVGRGITLCYETFGDPKNPPLLLVMGLATQMVAWRTEFCELLASQGFYVIRFDNRDVGRSTHMSGSKPPSVWQLLTRSPDSAAYTLADMADDAVGLLRKLGLAPAHIVGASMGGMIAQTIAVYHPDAVRSMTSIMSNTGSRIAGQPSPLMYPLLLRRPATDRDGYIKHINYLLNKIGSPAESLSEEDVAGRLALAEISYDRGPYAIGAIRQLGAIIGSGDRSRELRDITAPTLVIHGTADHLVPLSGGKATAKVIPGARLVTMEGMGHDLPRRFWSRAISEITEHANAADRLRGVIKPSVDDVVRAMDDDPDIALPPNGVRKLPGGTGVEQVRTGG